MKKVLICSVVATLIVSGCAIRQEMIEEQSEMMRAWKGFHISQVIASWGEPAEIISEGAGGKVYIWRSSLHLHDENAPNASLNLKYNRERMFWVNSEGIIYRWKWRGL